MLDEKKRMWIKRFIRLNLGLFLYGVGIVCTIHASVGLAPWDLFQQGLTLISGITMGQASSVVSAVLVVVDFIAKEKIGIGTLLNMILIGVYVDVLMLNHLIPIFDYMPAQLAMLAAGMLIIGFASFFYIGAGFGAGPRDGLTIALCKKTGKTVGQVRIGIESLVAAAGFLLGGSMGFGTAVMAFGLGICMQFAFRVCRFDVKAVEHQYIDDQLRMMYRDWNEKRAR